MVHFEDVTKITQLSNFSRSGDEESLLYKIEQKSTAALPDGSVADLPADLFGGVAGLTPPLTLSHHARFIFDTQGKVPYTLAPKRRVLITIFFLIDV